MIRQTLGRAKRFLTHDHGDGAAVHGAPTFAKLTQKRAPGPNGEIEEKTNELLHVVDVIKNGTTVKTGEFEALTRIFTGQKMYVDTRDISLAPHLMLDGMWEKEFTDFFRTFLKEDSVVFDIGANFGYYGLVAGATVEPGKGSIHFFEANPQLIPYITKTVSINGLNNRSSIVNNAVEATSGKDVELFVLQDYWGSSSLGGQDFGHGIPVEKRVKVKTITIDDYCRDKDIKKVDVIKMDIEGYEDHAYKGMRKLVKYNPDLKLFLEFTPTGYKNPGEFFEQLANDFDYIYALKEEFGHTIPTRVESFNALKQQMSGDFIMVLLGNTDVE